MSELAAERESREAERAEMAGLHSSLAQHQEDGSSLARELSVSREDADAHKGRSDALESELRVARASVQARARACACARCWAFVCVWANLCA